MSVSEETQSTPYPKLPFWHTIGLSYSTYFQNFIDALRASWLWLIVAAVTTYFTSGPQWSWMATVISDKNLAAHQSPPINIMLLPQLNSLFTAFAGVSIAVAWHRLMILDERPSFCGSNLVSKNLWHYVGFAVVLFLIAFCLPIVGLFFMIPLSLVLPARAIGDESLNFKKTWKRVRGNFWRLFWGIAFTTVPPILALQIVFWLTSDSSVPDMVSGENFVARMTATSVIFNVYYLLIVPISIGFLSHAYLHFFRSDLKTAPLV